MTATKDHWQDDRLNRADDAKFIATLLRNRSQALCERDAAKSFVLNIDSKWGGGKTFFLKRLRQDLAENHVAVYVDAWADDFADDPLIAVMAAIDEEIQARRDKSPAVVSAFNTVKANAGKVARIVGKGLLRRAIGLAVTEGGAEALEAIGTEAATVAADASAAMGQAAEETFDAVAAGTAATTIDEFRQSRDVIDQFKRSLKHFVEKLEQDKQIASPMFVLIDELDRCRPTYAISLLERVKHLFQIPNVVFVAATDTSELAHTVASVYGNNFNGRGYLKRFFDRTFLFEKPSLADLLGELQRQNPLDLNKFKAPFSIEPLQFITEFLEACDADLRAAEQTYDVLLTVSQGWSAKIEIELVVFLPLLWNHYRRGVFPRKEAAGNNLLDAPSDWPLKTTQYRRDSAFAQPVVVQGSELSDQFWTLAQEPMPTVERRNSTGQSLHLRYALDRISQELQNRFPSYDPGNPPRSLITEYPRIIAQAGRVRVG